MIGRNDINQAALLGSTAPHENSADLVAVAKRANNEGTKFDLDKLWMINIQSIGTLGRITFLMLVEAFFTSVPYSHHTPMDEAGEYFPKLYKMTEWMYQPRGY
jgi:hypothetical protein